MTIVCDYVNREAAMVVLDDEAWCDPCLAALIRALNNGGLPTVASCCGHGTNPGWVMLADERVLLVVHDLECAHGVEALIALGGDNRG